MNEVFFSILFNIIINDDFQVYSILIYTKNKKNLEDKDERKKTNNINDNRKQTSNRIR